MTRNNIGSVNWTLACLVTRRTSPDLGDTVPSLFRVPDPYLWCDPPAARKRPYGLMGDGDPRAARLLSRALAGRSMPGIVVRHGGPTNTRSTDHPVARVL